ncbi:reverse transcriptase [Operophtera brumata]|uniref:Reverse transcriptase n=1 Tax=Operophtera brumata TaxID=104452 RepID=A0A0L7LFB1_OPEBR|nr:reverse transcriptase [Operophtera brumata]
MNEELLNNSVQETAEIIMETDEETPKQANDQSELPLELPVSESSRQNKRAKVDDQEDSWMQVKSRRERIREIRGVIEISISSNGPFPKQFALAKLFKSQNITDITRVKYINPYKLIVEINGEESAERLIQCDHLLELGWRFQRPFEVGLSYGVIKNIELDLSEKDLLESLVQVRW